jgi:hypothetical protein
LVRKLLYKDYCNIVAVLERFIKDKLFVIWEVYMVKSWCELVIAVLVIVFAAWPIMYSKWILIALGVILAIHSFSCNKCFGK